MLRPRQTVRHAQDRENRRWQQSPKVKDYKSHQSPNTYPATLREVGPLNNNVREAPITTIMYRRMYCTTIPYQHPAPRNPAICCASQPKGTHITTTLQLMNDKAETATSDMKLGGYNTCAKLGTARRLGNEAPAPKWRSLPAIMRAC